MLIYEGPRSIWLGSAVDMLPDDRETAWAERSITPSKGRKFFVGRYVEADNANSNKQYWTLNDLLQAKESIIHSPVNFSHRHTQILGHYVDAEMLFPTEAASDGDIKNPFVESLGLLYAYYFPDEVALLSDAYKSGRLFQSMECIAESVTCSGPNGCGQEYSYRGPTDSSYCTHINERQSVKQLNKPTFLGGGLLVPPVLPGWGKAKIHDLSKLMETHAQQLEIGYEEIAQDMPHLDAKTWEMFMLMILEQAHNGATLHA